MMPWPEFQRTLLSTVPSENRGDLLPHSIIGHGRGAMLDLTLDYGIGMSDYET